MFSDAFSKFEEKQQDKYPSMKADCVDLPVEAATCDPSKLVPPGLWQEVSNADTLFVSSLPHSVENAVPAGADRTEYVKLVHRQLLCGKTLLHTTVKAVGDVFCVGKSNANRQREVWNGSRISEAAAEPPTPMLLANPSCFVDLIFRQGEEIFMSKRDVGTCFDVLRAPTSLQQWFGRPPVTLNGIMSICGVSSADLQQFIVCAHLDKLEPDTPLFPASTVWPMGFSWSSCIAQACVVECCKQAGVPQHAFMSMDCLPPSGAEACGVATDDTFFIHKSRPLAESRLTNLDCALESNGMPKNSSKDVDLEPSMTALGCELTSQPAAAEPASNKLVPLFAGFLDLLAKGSSSPRALNRSLGVEQWFCLLNRPMFSVFDSVYEFVRKEPEDKIEKLSMPVMTEVAVATFLMPLLGADLGREFLPLLTACDASPSYGFGVVYKPCSPELAEAVGSLAERRGDYVQFYPDPQAPPPKDRLGTPHKLPLHQKDFHVAISAKAKWKVHSGRLEAHGLLLDLKWLLRSPSNFHHRLPVLIDAKAVLGAAAKGRTSAPGVRGTIRHIAALLLGTNSLLRLVYVPSEHNPADKPSRGLKRVRRRFAKRGLRLTRHENRVRSDLEDLLQKYDDIDDMLSHYM